MPGMEASSSSIESTPELPALPEALAVDCAKQDSAPQAAAAGRKVFLDGLRGWSSVAVLLSHLVVCVWKISSFSQSGDRSFATDVPYVTDGGLGVYVFFVLSGFALSTGYFSKRRPAGLARLALQRYLRLTIPIFAVAVVTAICISAGAMRNAQAGEVMSNGWLGSFYRFQPTAELVMRFSFGDALFGPPSSFPTSLIPQAWTMPHEFRGSFMIFTLCWIFQDAKLHTPIYLLAALLINVYDSTIVGFIYGMAIAQAYEHARFQRFRVTWWGRAASGALLVLAAGISILQNERSGTSRSIWLSFIALLIVLGCSCSDWAATLLSCRLSLWLGRVSFPLYLSHFIIMCSWQSWIILRLLQDGNLSIPAIQTISVITTGFWSFALAAVLVWADEQGIKVARLSASMVMTKGYRELWQDGRQLAQRAAAAVAARLGLRGGVTTDCENIRETAAEAQCDVNRV